MHSSYQEDILRLEEQQVRDTYWCGGVRRGANQPDSGRASRRELCGMNWTMSWLLWDYRKRFKVDHLSLLVR